VFVLIEDRHPFARADFDRRDLILEFSGALRGREALLRPQRPTILFFPSDLTRLSQIFRVPA
jgi:hypothetical protein